MFKLFYSWPIADGALPVMCVMGKFIGATHAGGSRA